ncbi:MAG: hypothetical protein JF621_07905 [Streptomyces turgidiscabies]|nr:hypothetical protein [Streptomyces turgidiscabies]
MATCEVCGNSYGMTFEVHAQGAVLSIDSFYPLAAAERRGVVRGRL